MNPDYYANEYRRYQSFVRDYNNEHHIQKICCGAPHEDYEWTKEVMATCSVELTKNSMDLWMDFPSTIMYIQRGLKSKEAQRSLMKMSGIRR